MHNVYAHLDEFVVEFVVPYRSGHLTSEHITALLTVVQSESVLSPSVHTFVLA
jgi:hypothetical protein